MSATRRGHASKTETGGRRGGRTATKTTAEETGGAKRGSGRAGTTRARATEAQEPARKSRKAARSTEAQEPARKPRKAARATEAQEPARRPKKARATEAAQDPARKPKKARATEAQEPTRKPKKARATEAQEPARKPKKARTAEPEAPPEPRRRKKAQAEPEAPPEPRRRKKAQAEPAPEEQLPLALEEEQAPEAEPEAPPEPRRRKKAQAEPAPEEAQHHEEAPPQPREQQPAEPQPPRAQQPREPRAEAPREPAQKRRRDRDEEQEPAVTDEVSPDGEPLDEEPIPAAAPEPSHGIVALVGRPNTGKSTLFNRLVGRRIAIVHDEPGVTRDRHYAYVTSGTKRYTLIDTGGLDPESEDPMRQGIARQVEVAIAEADVVVCVLDARAPLTPAEHAELALLRRSRKPVIYVANKADSPRFEAEAADLYRLGMERLLPISALHGRGIGDLEDAIEEALPAEPVAEAPSHEGAIRVAIIGRPNAGKSSLVNRLAGAERMLVDAQPGTTRDAIDTMVERDGRRFLFIDTAGIRRKAKVYKAGSAVEAVSVLQAIRAMERAEVVVLLCDAAEGVSEQDAKIMGLAEERGRGLIIALNKMDLLDKKRLDKAEEDARDKLSFVPWASIAGVSAMTGRGVGRLLHQIAQVAEVYRKRVPTGELNRFFERVLATHPPPTHGGRAPRLFFITQAETSPPLFVVVASDPAKIHFSYRRYVANQLRKAFGLEGVPVRVKYKERRRRE